MTSGARVIDSTPPATNRSPAPAWIAWAAVAIACRPEAHSRLTVWPGDAHRQAREQRGHAPDVAVVLARLVRGAEDDVLDVVGVAAGAPHGLGDDERREVVGPHAGERAAVAAERRAAGRDDDGAP